MDKEIKIKKLKSLIGEKSRALKAFKTERLKLSARLDNASRANAQGVELGDNEFYFRCSLDFRGRIYYKSSHMNPQMADDIKVMLTLAEPKPLGEKGWQWLLWGVAEAADVKGSFKERVQWAEDNLLEIIQAAISPADSELFSEQVMNGGSPALFLQRANEIRQAGLSGDIYSYRTAITIAMDATCSGLQLLSAVARDRQGGEMVNLTPSSSKQDVYQAICDLVMAKYNDPTNAFHKHMMDNKAMFKRRFTKKAVMTLPYSATIDSAKGYVRDEFRGNMEKGDAPFPLPSDTNERLAILDALPLFKKYADNPKYDDDTMYRALSTQIAHDIHEACYARLPAAMNLLAFFKSTPKHLPSHAYWHTPDGLYVKQVYGSKERKQVQYIDEKIDPETGEIIGKGKVLRKYMYIDATGKDPSKASNGMPPNWVHSLDGTLVRRVVGAADFPVVCIHDSFAAHPNDCETLAKILREQFVRLVEDRPLENLIDSLNKQVGANVFSAKPLVTNTWDPKDALQSEFLFC
jgi:DNA-directed RNA polymerase